ncbi:ABC transporter permease [Deinococcus sp. KNUC1210]|uniref:ABC transporter permease n=1 Tax=Deinococcus sp. KNUC1210 TaxID=2917691 RepID=UPI001EF0FC2B|nr:ABC transporter permease [Deinococcus sp. KNUC1210]ULH14907.1 ABC transporter permease [Deinococcus sp. KNUC1210]
MLTLLRLEFLKLLGARSVRIALLVCFLLPWLWSFAPRLQQVYGLVLTSGFQVPAISLITTVQFILPLFVALSCAEMIGVEVAQGTLAPLLLRPIDRNRVMLSKLVAALLYPALLLLALLLGSFLAGIRLGFGDFTGGSGLGPGGFIGQGALSSSMALTEVLRGYALAALVMAPIAALGLLFGVIFLNTAAAALATIATLQVMRLLTVFPEGFQKILLTTHLDVYLRQGDITQSLILLIIYTAGFSLLTIFAFDRRDV